MPDKDGKQPPNKAAHQRRAAEALRQNLRRRKDQQRRQTPGAQSPDPRQPADDETGN
ncbi:hypothetical protein [Emcibacter sp. SYSU 3D8]|uniref:hypothetical protein n=1 Tax=Emcibacter sp. SYSU 3D8 TaxID=3133969 RepID=UPI0031FED4F5